MVERVGGIGAGGDRAFDQSLRRIAGLIHTEHGRSA
jgi:hypothetical protein